MNERYTSANSFEDPAQRMTKPENVKVIWRRRKVRSKGRVVKRPIPAKGYKHLTDPVTNKVVQHDENASSVRSAPASALEAGGREARCGAAAAAYEKKIVLFLSFLQVSLFLLFPAQRRHRLARRWRRRAAGSAQR